MLKFHRRITTTKSQLHLQGAVTKDLETRNSTEFIKTRSYLFLNLISNAISISKTENHNSKHKTSIQAKQLNKQYKIRSEEHGEANYECKPYREGSSGTSYCW